MTSLHARGQSERKIPDDIVYRIFHYLSITDLYRASLVCARWRNLIYHSGAPSQTLLKQHLATLRGRFGVEQIPRKLPLTSVRKYLLLYAKRELFGTRCSSSRYHISALLSPNPRGDSCVVPLRLRRFALCETLVAFVVKSRILIFQTNQRPMSLLTTVESPSHPIALAVSESFLAILCEKRLHLYQLLARGTPNFLVTHVYSIDIPDLQSPAAVAITPDAESPPLAAVLGAELHLIHPSHALSEKRDGFFRDDCNFKAPSASQKLPERRVSQRRHRWILTAPGTSIGAAFPITFAMSGRQLMVCAKGAQNHSEQRSAYLGSAWTASDIAEITKRKLYGIEPGEELMQNKHDADSLFSHYKARSSSIIDTAGAPLRWMPRHLDTAEMEVEDAVHLWDAFYILTEVETGWVRIVNVAPFESRLRLYRRPREREGGTTRHCHYAVYDGGPKGRGGYVAFLPSEGRLNVLPFCRIPFQHDDASEDIGWELVQSCRDIPVGVGEIIGMFAKKKSVALVFEERMVFIDLWPNDLKIDSDEQWDISAKGEVTKDGGGKRRRVCSRRRCVVM